MITIAIIHHDKNSAEKMQLFLKDYIVVKKIYPRAKHLIKYKTIKPSIILFCNENIIELENLKEKYSKSTIILYGVLDSKKLIIKAIQLGIKNFIHYTQNNVELLNAIENICKGNSYISNLVSIQLVNYIEEDLNSKSNNNIIPYNKLSERELMVIEQLLIGLSYKGISLELNVSIDTIRKHVTSIYKKLNIHSKGELYHLHHQTINSEKFNPLYIK